MKIGNKFIDNGHLPFICADISGNHEQNKDKAIALIKATKEAGCDAVKFQTYKPEELSHKGLGQFKGKATIDLYELYQSIYMPYEWYPDLFAYAKEIDLIAFTTIFNPQDMEMLEKLDCPAYKISSYEINYVGLLNAVLETKKPAMISTGCASYSDLVFIADRFSPLNTILLKCVSAYPAPPELFNLKTMPAMKEQFGFDIGLSDHSYGSAIACASVAMGAVAIEKHITLSKTTSIDGHFALLPDEMKSFVYDIHTAWKALGTVDFETPIKSREYMRSLYAIKPIKKGEKFTSSNIGFLRPNKGLNPKAYRFFTDKIASMDIESETPLQKEHAQLETSHVRFLNS